MSRKKIALSWLPVVLAAGCAASSSLCRSFAAAVTPIPAGADIRRATVTEFLAAFDSGDPTRIQTFVRRHMAQGPARTAAGRVEAGARAGWQRLPRKEQDPIQQRNAPLARVVLRAS